jgi:hypothetical protein
MQGMKPTRLSKKNLLALAAAALLAACGGGNEPELTAQQALVKNLEAKAAVLRANAMTKAQAATALMNLAEQTYPNFFPSGAVEGTYGPFMFRYYPSTGNYLGVVVAADATYAMDGIYVVGPAFGNSLSNPSFVGQVTAYVDTSGGTGGNTGGGNTGADNGCFDLASSEVQGHRTQISWEYSGTITGTVSEETIVGGMTTFEGRSARETTTTMTGTTTHSGSSQSIDSSTRAYGLRTGTTEYTTYGMVSTSNFSYQGTSYASTYTTVYSPPATDTGSALALGQSQNVTHAGTSSYTMTGSPPSQPYSFSYTTTNTYVARETITVPAGTYETCKFTSQEAGADATTTWYVVGRGIPVKTTHGGTSSFTMQATSVKVNGAAI